MLPWVAQMAWSTCKCNVKRKGRNEINTTLNLNRDRKGNHRMIAMSKHMRTQMRMRKGQLRAQHHANEQARKQQARESDHVQSQERKQEQALQRVQEKYQELQQARHQEQSQVTSTRHVNITSNIWIQGDSNRKSKAAIKSESARTRTSKSNHMHTINT